MMVMLLVTIMAMVTAGLMWPPLTWHTTYEHTQNCTGLEFTLKNRVVKKLSIRYFLFIKLRINDYFFHRRKFALMGFPYKFFIVFLRNKVSYNLFVSLNLNNV